MTATKRILVFGMTENPGGVESFLRNYYHHMDRELIQFDFLCNSYNPIAYEDEFIGMGAKTIHFPPRHSHPIGFHCKLNAFFKAHASEYDAIWVNVNSLANIDYLKLAKRYGIPKRIIHSHNSENMDSGLKGKIRGFLHQKNKPQISKWATDFWACAEGAADFFYEGELRKRAIVIHNAIDVKRMEYSEEERKKLRNELGVSDDTVVFGNVGRLHFQKNQSFLLDWFAAYHKAHENALLVLIGAGEDEMMLKEKTAQLQIGEAVRFAGLQSNIPGWMSAFDVFAFPSVFEGVSLVGLEAQANGLPILASGQAIPPEAILFPHRVRFMELSAPVAQWVEATENLLQQCPQHEEDVAHIEKVFDEAGYNIHKEAKEMYVKLGINK